MHTRSLALLIGMLWAASPAASTATWHSHADLLQRVEDYVRSQSTAAPGRLRIQVAPLDSRLRLPQCRNLHLATLGSSTARTAQTVTIQCRDPSQWTVYVPVRLQLLAPVLVASRPLAAGQRLTPGDLVVAERDVSAAPAGTLASEEQAIGQELNTSVAAGVALRWDMLKLQDAIHQGQAVALVAESKGLRLTAEGVALQNGKAGQYIAARNSKSGVVVRGLVQENGELQIPF